MPMRPPRSDRVSASTRNWARMSRPRAPTALRMPISRVRSRTDTSMMFMIPMPPTMSEIEAMPPSSRVRVALIDEAASSSWVWLKTLKSAVSVGARSWRSRSSAVMAVLGGGHLRRVADRHADGPDRAARHPVVLDHADRDEDHVVRVLEPGPALGLEDADDPERQAADRDLRPDVARPEPEVRRRGRAQDRHAQVVAGRGIGQERALPHVVGADHRICRGGADDRGRRARPCRPSRSGWSRSREPPRRSTAGRRSRSRRRATACWSWLRCWG